MVPDPDVALRQEAAEDDEDERERASLAGDDGAAAASADGTAQLAGEATIVETAPAAAREDEPEAGLRVAGDVSGAVAGVLDAGFEHEPLEEGVAEILDMPVEPGPDQDLRERDRLDGDVYHERERAELQLHNQGAAGKQVRGRAPPVVNYTDEILKLFNFQLFWIYLKGTSLPIYLLLEISQHYYFLFLFLFFGCQRFY